MCVWCYLSIDLISYCTGVMQQGKVQMHGCKQLPGFVDDANGGFSTD